MTLVTFLYLEWHRACQLKRSALSKKEKERWHCQRTYGLCVAIRQHTDRADLDYLAEALQTTGGIRRLRRRLHKVAQKEYRTAA